VLVFQQMTRDFSRALNKLQVLARNWFIETFAPVLIGRSTTLVFFFDRHLKTALLNWKYQFSFTTKINTSSYRFVNKINKSSAIKGLSYMVSRLVNIRSLLTKGESRFFKSDPKCSYEQSHYKAIAPLNEPSLRHTTISIYFTSNGSLTEIIQSSL